MSIIKSIKQVLGLGPAAENHHWDGSVPNQLSLKRGTPEAPGTELIKALNGILSFPNQGQSLEANGYVVLPGGLIVQWGLATTDVNGDVFVSFPIAFPNAMFQAVATFSSSVKNDVTATVIPFNTSGMSLGAFVGGTPTPANISWLAIGH